MHLKPVDSPFLEARSSIDYCRDNVISTAAFLSMTKQAMSILQYFIDFSDETIIVFDQTVTLANSTTQSIKTICDRSIQDSASVVVVSALCNAFDQTNEMTSLVKRVNNLANENAKRAEEHFTSINAISTATAKCSIKSVADHANQLSSKLSDLQDLLTMRFTQQSNQLTQAITSLSQFQEGASSASPVIDKKNDEQSMVQVFLNALQEADRDLTDAQINHQRQEKKVNQTTERLTQSLIDLKELSQIHDAFLAAESVLGSLAVALRESALSITDALDVARDLTEDWSGFTDTNIEGKRAVVHLDEFIQQRAKSNSLVSKDFVRDSRAAKETIFSLGEPVAQTLIQLVDLLNRTSTLNDRLLIHATYATTLHNLLTVSFAGALKATEARLEDEHHARTDLHKKTGEELRLLTDVLNEARTKQSVAFVALQTAQAAINQR